MKTIGATAVCTIIISILSVNSAICTSEKELSYVGVDASTRKAYQHLSPFPKIGVNFYGIEQLRWYFVEPAPPKDGVHRFKWAGVDEIVKKIERVGGRALITIVCASTWATTSKKRTRVASPPENSHWDDYRYFVEALVERYDNDGYRDMPGLKFAHRHFQIEDEAENRSSWQGSEKDYLKLLKTASEGARRANPNVKILTFSPNLGDFFDHSDRRETKAKLEKLGSSNPKILSQNKVGRKLRFIQTTLKEHDFFDIVAIQYNYHYTGLFGVINLIRKFSSKPILVADAASVTLLGRHQRIKAEYVKEVNPFLSEIEIADILSNIRHSRHREIGNWWETEQAITSFKKIVTAASLGVDHIFLQFILDQKSNPEPADQSNVNPWNFSGLLGKNRKMRPVCHAVKLFHEKLAGFSEVEDLSQRMNAPSEWIFYYRFKVRGKVLDVLWTDGGDKKFNTKSNATKLSATSVIGTGADRSMRNEIGDVPELIIGKIPIVVEYLN